MDWKGRIIEAIDRRREDIIGYGRAVLEHPELGYRETQTSALVQDVFGRMGIPCQSGLALTGVKGKISGKDAPVNVCVIGEMDAIRCWGHPHADPETGAAHACGHNAQVASLLGAAHGLVESGVLEELWGSVTFFAVPAEEFVELEYRQSLIEAGKIGRIGGKQELLRLGAFDDVDMAMMIHSQAGILGPDLYLDGSSLGFTAKQIAFTGRASHASAPFEGVNALNAAMLALMGIHANRETFRDEDHIRVHPILTNGGELVNVVPARAEMETYVRGARQAAIDDACKKVDAAIRGGAMAVGAACDIRDIPGYQPLHQNVEMGRLMEQVSKLLPEMGHITHGMDMTGSTDMGDLSAVMPCIQPTMGGFAGTAHGADFAVSDENAAYILPAKLMALTVASLLDNHAEQAMKIKERVQHVE